MRYQAAVIAVLLVMIAPVRGADEEAVSFAIALDANIQTLLDPHASSRDKLHACRMLGEMGPAARPAALALARQSHYDMEPVRELATAALLRVVGAEEAARLREQVLAMDLGVPVEATNSFLKTAKGWEDFPRVAEFLKMQSPSIKLAAARAALRIWDGAPALPKDTGRIFVDESKVDLLHALSSSYPSLSAKERQSALALAGAVGTDRAEAAPMLIRAACDADSADLRTQAREHLDQLLKTRPVSELSVWPLMDLAFDEPEPRPKEAAMALNYLGSTRAVDRPKVVRAVVYRIARGDNASPLHGLLKSLGEDRKPLVTAAMRVGLVSDEGRRRQLAKVFDPTNQPGDVRSLVSLVTSPDGALRLEAATLAATDPATFEPMALVDAWIGSSVIQSPDVVRVLLPDAKRAGERVAWWLREGTFSQKVAAMQMLKVTGVDGDEVKAQLNRVLELDDHDARVAAATLLGRQDVLARERVPQLLADLRSDNHNARALAARQLDELGVAPREVTAALIRAVDRRDLAARVGLVDALAVAHATRRSALDVIKESAERTDDAGKRAYARAALREVAAAGN
jgi:hypothetical protein